MMKTWKLGLTLPTALWTMLLCSTSVSAETATQVELNRNSATLLADAAVQSSSPFGVVATSPNVPAPQPSAGMEQVPRLADLEQASPAPGMAQVTSVSQFSDVKPTDWAFQALQSLVERYGCIVGYPDKTYRGSRAITRYEFAAGLNACLDKIQELIAAATSDFVRREDLEVVKRLQEEFAAELAALRGRVEALEVRTATLEKQQFSTTTRLTGNVFVNFTGTTAFGDPVLAERSTAAPGSAFAAPRRDTNNRPTRVSRFDPEPTLSYYTFLNFTTSFTGRDSLVVQLVSGNGNSPANQFVSAGFFNTWGTPFFDQTGVVTTGTVAVRELFYQFPVGNNVRVAIGPRLNYYRYFDGTRFNFFLTGATSFNSNGSTLLSAIDRGSGAVVTWNISPQFTFTAGYLAENTEFLNAAAGFNTSSSPARGDGLFGGSNITSAQLQYSPSRNFNVRLIYAFSNLKAYNGFVGGSVGEPLPYGYADDGFGGTLRTSTADTFVANFDWLITPKFGIFGRYSYGITDINPRNPLRNGGQVRVQSIQAGLGFPDLGKRGALGVLSFVIPHDFKSGTRFLLSGAGDGGIQYELEASYYYPINDNLALVPAVYAIFNPNNFDANPTVFVGNLRAQFSF